MCNPKEIDLKELYSLLCALMESGAESDPTPQGNPGHNGPAGPDGCPTAADILDTAKSLVTGDRKQSYGDARQSHQLIADFWSIYMERVQSRSDARRIRLHPRDVALLMILFKVARASHSLHHSDSYVDICGYAALGGSL